MHTLSRQGLGDPIHRHPVLKVTLACLVILLLAQTLIGALSLSALNKLMIDTTADRVEVMARSAAGRIDSGLRLGKPLTQYFGLTPILQDTLTRAEDARGAAVLLQDGSMIAEVGTIGPDAARLVRGFSTGSSDSGVTQRLSGALMAVKGGMVTLAVPLKAANGLNLGAIVIAAVKNEQMTYGLISKNLQVLLMVTLLVGGGLSVLIKYLLPRGYFAAGQRVGFVVPLLALMAAQGVYATYTISTFRSAWLEVTRSNVSLIAQGLQRDLDRVLGYGISVQQLKSVEAPFARLAATFPTIAYVELIDQTGKILVRAGARQILPIDDPFARIPAADDGLTVRLPLGAGQTGQAAQGEIILQLDGAVIAAGVRSRMLDAVTVVGVALVAAIEMLLLLSLVLDTSLGVQPGVLSRPRSAAQEEAQVGRVARPIMFSFLFAWALPMGFLPLYARSLLVSGLNWAPALLLALPISVEMGCGLLTSLVAGRLTDRRGWQVPVLVGLGVAGAGMFACTIARDLWMFIAARGLVGLGYGLTWMGLQGFIVTRSTEHYSGRNMTNVIAGLFAGHLSGAAVGAMLVEQIGFRAVFAVGAVILIVPLAGVLTVMRPYLGRWSQVAMPAVTHVRTRVVDVMHLFFSRGFGLLLIGSVIPFSIAQVGLLSYALPLYLEEKGVGTASVGRVLMMYGLCVIYVGPVMGRLLDRSTAKKAWIVVGGLVGSAGMLLLYYLNGLPAAATAVLMLALASCFTGASQAPYMLSQPDVQRYGAAAATSIMRAADKLGQMVGPLVVGAMVGSFGLSAGLATTGALYLLATLIFLIFGASLVALYKRA